MYFWDVQSLKNDIRANKLSEKDIPVIIEDA